MKDECRDVLAEVWAFLDGEAPAEQAEAIRDHLEGCEPCLAEYDFQDALKALVKRSCRESAPAALRARIVTQITRTVAVEGGRAAIDVTSAVHEVRVVREP